MSNDNVSPRDEQGSDQAPQSGTQGKEKSGSEERAPGRRMPAAGPHADPSLVNPDLTPCTGSLPTTRQGGYTDPGNDLDPLSVLLPE